MFCRLYSSIWYKLYFFSTIYKQYFKEMTVDNIERGIIVNEQVRGFGVFTADHKFVKSSTQVRRNNGQFVPKYNKNNIPYVDKEVVFVGNVYPEFGHFLLEHMNRAWALFDNSYRGKTVVLINNQNVNPVPRYMFDFLALCGVPYENILILNETTQFKRVYVPHQAFNIPVYSSSEFGITFDKISAAVGDGMGIDKIYVSRDKLKSRRTYGERYVQSIFEQNGYTVIYPETLSLNDQIKYIKDCKMLAGCAGTALHLALFMKPGGTVVQIKRNKMYKSNACVQYLINKTKKLNSVFIDASIECARTQHGATTPQIIGVNKNLKQFFIDNNFDCSNVQGKIDCDSWNEYITALNQWRRENGSVWINKLKRLFVRVSAWFILGREKRGQWRRFLTDKLKIR